jgi:hypothetical protein
MLWLLATLSVVSISRGIAHRLKTVSPPINCTGELCTCRASSRRMLVQFRWCRDGYAMYQARGGAGSARVA